VHTELVRLLAEAKTKQTVRLELDREVKRLKAEEDELKAQLILAMEKAGLSDLAVDDVGHVTLREHQKPYIVDYSQLEQYIIDNKATDLLQKRLTESAVKARWDDDIQIPGVGLITETKITIS
jgi:hypothetical protein